VVDASVDDVVAQASVNAAVFVRSERSEDLARALAGPGVAIEHHGRGAIELHGLRGRQIGEIAVREGIVLDELTPRQASLEEAFMALTGDLFVLPGSVALLPASTADAVNPYLPLNAGFAVATSTFDNSHHLAPWTGLAVFAGYAVLAVVVAAAASCAATPSRPRPRSPRRARAGAPGPR
jgi:hypothetical protein